VQALGQTIAVLASIATILGICVALSSFGRRITVDVSAPAIHRHGDWVYIPSRARLKAGGLFGIDFARKGQHAAISVDEITATDEGKVTLREVQKGWPIFEEQRCSAGEELVTDRVMVVHYGGSDVIGWRVVFQVIGKTLPRRQEVSWTSEVFVAVED
jgi:hypothetical protein